MKILFLIDELNKQEGKINETFDLSDNIITVADLINEINKIYHDNENKDKFNKIMDILKEYLRTIYIHISPDIGDLIMPEVIEMDILLMINEDLDQGLSMSELYRKSNLLGYSARDIKTYLRIFYRKKIITLTRKDGKFISAGIGANGETLIKSCIGTSVYQESEKRIEAILNN
jgi:hypothetical protein